MAYRRPRQPTTILWKPAISEWGKILGTLSNQTDLQTALDAKLSLIGGTMIGNLDMNLNQILNLKIEQVASLPASGNVSKLIYLTTDNHLHVDQG